MVVSSGNVLIINSLVGLRETKENRQKKVKNSKKSCQLKKWNTVHLISVSSIQVQ